MLFVGIALIFCAVSLIAAKLTCDLVFARIEYRDGFMPCKPEHRRVWFDCCGHRNCGYIFEAENSKALVVFCCGLNSSIFDYAPFVERLVNEGMTVFSFDATGNYLSAGASSRGFVQAIFDLEAALDYVEGDPLINAPPLLLMGHSRGGFALSCVLKGRPRVKAAAAVSAINSTLETIMYPVFNLFGPFGYLVYPFVFIYQSLLFPPKLVLRRADRSLNLVTTPVMIVHGQHDRVIGHNRGSLMSKRRHISNPNVRFLTASEKGCCGHSNLLKSTNIGESLVSFFISHLQ